MKPRGTALLLTGLLAACALLLLWDPLSGPGAGASGEHQGAGSQTEAAADHSASNAKEAAAAAAAGRSDAQREQAASAANTTSDRVRGIPSFRGRLLLPSGAPAAGAEVRAYGFPGQALIHDPSDPRARSYAELRATADARGDFVLSESPLGGLRFLLHARYPNMPALELADLPVRTGGTRDLGDLSFTAPVELSGLVLDQDGMPVAGAEIAVVRESPGAALSPWLSSHAPELADVGDETGRDGSFSVSGLPSGMLRVVARAPGFLEASSAPALAAPGNHFGEMQVIMERGRVLVGRVLFAGGGPAVGALVEASYGRSERSQATSDEDGLFSLYLPLAPGRVTLLASAQDHLRARLRLRAEELDLVQEMVLLPMLPLPGIVVDIDGRPVPAARVGLFEESRARFARMSPQNCMPLSESRSGEDGRFTLDVDLSATREGRFVAVAWDEVHAPGTSPPLRLDYDASRVPVEPVQVRMKNGTGLSGTVFRTDGTALAGARVHLLRHLAARGSRDLNAVLMQSHGQIVARASSDGGGRFEFKGLPPGDYHLEGFHRGWSPARSEEFALIEGDSGSWDLTLAPHSSIAGKVTGPRESFGPLRVLATALDGACADALVAADGSYQFEPLVPDTYRLEVYEIAGTHDLRAWGRSRGASLSPHLEIELGESENRRQELPLDLSSLAGLEGIVFQNGQPATDYRVHLMRSGYEGSNATGDKLLVRESLRTVVTDYQGKYSFAGLPSDEYWVVVAGPRQRRDNVGRASFSGLMAKEGPRGLARARLDLDGGKTAQRDFMLASGGLHGVALRPAGKGKWAPVRGGIGYLVPRNELEGVSRITFTLGKKGGFEVQDIPAGNWQLELRSGRYLLKNAPVRIDSGQARRREYQMILGPKKAAGKAAAGKR